MSRSLRFAIVAPHYAEYAFRLALALAREHQVLLFVDRTNFARECGQRFDERPVAGLQLVSFNSLGRAARIAACAQIAARLAQFRPTVVNLQEEESRFTTILSSLLRRFAPIILTVHDPSPHTGSDAVYASVNAPHQFATRASASAFHVHGPYCRDALIKEVGATRPILSTQHAVLLEPKPWEIRIPDPGRLLLFGRMEAYKGLETLLDATEILGARGAAFTLTLAGKGPEIDRLRSRMVACPRIEILDRFLPAEEAVEQFQRASVVVVPYLNATQSGVVAAAFGNARPVVASNVGGLADSIDHGVNGLLIPPGDVGGLAEALAACLFDVNLRARLGDGALRAGRTDFSWSRVAEALLAFATDIKLKPTLRE